MFFQPTKLKDAYIIETDRKEDERGFFARTWCQEEFTEQGLDTNLVQCSISYNKKKGTLRGMHWQIDPFAETKLVRCTQGAIYDVIVDLREDSESYRQWIGVELTPGNRKALYVPKGFAHGFQTLEDDTEVFYQISEFYAPDCARGFPWNDPTFKINWPLEVSVISNKDRQYEVYQIASVPLS
jgi:dTDP-4-dehydrorhamnose 3,5-epimerase